MSLTAASPDEVLITCSKSQDLPGNWTQIEPLVSGKRRLWYEHPTLGHTADMVALPLTDIQDVMLYPYDLTEPSPAIAYGPPEPVSVVGFPFDLSVSGSVAIWATGFVASEPEIDVDDLPVFLIDCRSRQGQSGSPVIIHKTGAVAYQGGMVTVGTGTHTNLLGMYSGRINKESDIGIVWKRAALRELVDSLPP